MPHDRFVRRTREAGGRRGVIPWIRFVIPIDFDRVLLECGFVQEGHCIWLLVVVCSIAECGVIICSVG